MTQVASRDLRNQTRSLLDRVEGGEQITITVNGRPVADLAPHSSPRGMSPSEFARRLKTSQADPALRDELADMFDGETTDDLD
jgi:prevent-host-death family protein